MSQFLVLLPLCLLLVTVWAQQEGATDFAYFDPPRNVDISQAVNNKQYSCLFTSVLDIRPELPSFRLSKLVAIGVRREQLQASSNALTKVKSLKQMEHFARGRFGENAQLELRVSQFNCRCLDHHCAESRMELTDYVSGTCFGFVDLRQQQDRSCVKKWMPCGEFLGYVDEAADEAEDKYLREFEESSGIAGFRSGSIRPLVLPENLDSAPLGRLVYNLSYNDLNKGPLLEDSLIFQGTGLTDIRAVVIEKFARTGEVDEESMFHLEGIEDMAESIGGRIERVPADAVLKEDSCVETRTSPRYLLECFANCSATIAFPGSNYVAQEDSLVCPGGEKEDRRYPDVRSYEIADPLVRDAIQETTVGAPMTAAYVEIALLAAIVVVVAAGDAVRPIVLLQYWLLPKAGSMIISTCYFVPKCWQRARTFTKRMIDKSTQTVVGLAAIAAGMPTSYLSALSDNWVAPKQPERSNDKRRRRRRCFYVSCALCVYILMLLVASGVTLLPIAFTIINEWQLRNWNLELIDTFVRKIPHESGEGYFVEIYSVQINVIMMDTKLSELIGLAVAGLVALFISEGKAIVNVAKEGWKLMRDVENDDNQGDSGDEECFLQRFMSKYQNSFSGSDDNSEQARV